MKINSSKHLQSSFVKIIMLYIINIFYIESKYGPSISPLVVDIAAQSNERLHVKIYDPNNKRWEIPTRYVYTNKHTNKHNHIYIHMYMYMYMYLPVQMHTFTCSTVHVHAIIHVHANIYVHVHVHCTCTCTCTLYMYIHIHAYINIPTHTHILTHTHAQINKYLYFSNNLFSFSPVPDENPSYPSNPLYKYMYSPVGTDFHFSVIRYMYILL